VAGFVCQALPIGLAVFSKFSQLGKVLVLQCFQGIRGVSERSFANICQLADMGK